MSRLKMKSVATKVKSPERNCSNSPTKILVCFLKQEASVIRYFLVVRHPRTMNG